MKKAQMELMGIAIVVVLISLAFLFVVRFVILREPNENRQSFQESELAANFLNTMLDTNAPECSEAKFSTLLQDCANYYDQGRISCQYQGMQMQSCGFLQMRLGTLFSDTFGVWFGPNRNAYFFTAYRDPQNPDTTDLPILQQGVPCTGDRRLKIQPLPTGGSTLYLSLSICS